MGRSGKRSFYTTGLDRVGDVLSMSVEYGVLKIKNEELKIKN